MRKINPLFKKGTYQLNVLPQNGGKKEGCRKEERRKKTWKITWKI